MAPPYEKWSTGNSSNFDVARGRRIGLYGGAFNPAHSGHMHVAQCAKTGLKLDAVWWLTNRHYPHKGTDNLAPLEQRIAGIRQLIGRRPGMYPTTIEIDWRTLYSFDLVSKLNARCGGRKFVLIMGADQWRYLHLWRNWVDLVRAVPVAVFDRPGCFFPATSSLASNRFHRSRLKAGQDLVSAKPPAWRLITGRMLDVSSSQHRRLLAETQSIVDI